MTTALAGPGAPSEVPGAMTAGLGTVGGCRIIGTWGDP